MGILFRIVTGIILTACGGLTGGSSALVTFDVQTAQIFESVNRTSAIAIGTTGTMCVYYHEVNCNGEFIHNKLEYIAKPQGVYVPPATGAEFIPTGMGDTPTDLEKYADGCKEFSMDNAGNVLFLDAEASSTSGSPVFRSNVSFKTLAANPHCSTKVSVRNVRLIAVTRSNPNKLYISDLLLDKSCQAGGDDDITCSYSVPNALLTYDRFSIVSNWPIHPDWLNGGLYWNR